MGGSDQYLAQGQQEQQLAQQRNRFHRAVKGENSASVSQTYCIFVYHREVEEEIMMRSWGFRVWD